MRWCTFIIVCIGLAVIHARSDMTSGELHLGQSEGVLAENKRIYGPAQALWIFFKSEDGLHEENSMRRRSRESNIVQKPFIERILQLDGLVRLRTKSSWLNAISVDVVADSASQLRVLLQRIASLEFVDNVDFVRSEIPSDSAETEEAQYYQARRSSEDYGEVSLNSSEAWYGLSFEQLQMLHIPELHAKGLNGSGVSILMMDSGFYLQHECIRSDLIIDERDFVGHGISGDGRSRAEHHGTATLSILAGYKPGKYVGVAFGASILLARSEDITKEAPIEEDYMVAAVEWGEKNGVKVISCSLGYRKWYHHADMDGKTSRVAKAVNIAIELGITVVMASGNAGRLGITTPADSDGITVGAVDEYGFIGSFSSIGPTADGRVKPEVCAKGTSIAVADNSPEKTYIWKDGTSFAAPLVAGVAALLLQAHPDWTPEIVKEALVKTAWNPDSKIPSPSITYGYGLINAAAALEYKPELKCSKFCDPSLGSCDDAGRCVCISEAHYGRDCTMTKVDCSSYCTENGACKGYLCKCFLGWSGVDCSHKFEESRSVPQVAFGTLVLSGAAFGLILFVGICGLKPFLRGSSHFIARQSAVP
eukprot:TRINITY_DN4709_c0_g1_i1.p1 TRINITY_DN4709_c0_g1~~TRINITY_DN4709_c0_g1_i1.p1  ORF type:complete len:592 (-),score=71.40 TRINITY_DN4709_c0_g1_i1:987-2762(-)